MNLGVPWKADNFLIGWATTSFSREAAVLNGLIIWVIGVCSGVLRRPATLCHLRPLSFHFQKEPSRPSIPAPVVERSLSTEMLEREGSLSGPVRNYTGVHVSGRTSHERLSSCPRNSELSSGGSSHGRGGVHVSFSGFWRGEEAGQKFYPKHPDPPTHLRDVTVEEGNVVVKFSIHITHTM